MENNIDYILSRLLSGNASFDDMLFLSEWLHEDALHKEEFRLLKGYWDAEVLATGALAPAFSFHRLQKVIDRKAKARGGKKRRLLLLSSVAAILVLGGILFGFFLPAPPGSPIRHYTYLTANHRAAFVLNDGTKVTLNKHSRLTYTGDYGTGNRLVELEGEAYFEVAKDPGRQFEVCMGDASVCVLGTVFSVCAPAAADQVTTTLLAGSVCFKCPGQQVTLTPSQQLVFSRSNCQVAVGMVDTEEETAWKDGLLKYKSVALSKLIADLKDIYRVQLCLDNRRLASSDITVSGTFSENQPIEQILDVVTRSLLVTWTKKDGVYYIK